MTRALRPRAFALHMLLLALALRPASAAAQTPCSDGATVEFVTGFRDLVEALGPMAGEPLECEHADGTTGDVLQQTTSGLLCWRKSTNTPPFTDGAQHWALREGELLEWSSDDLDPPIAADSPSVEPRAAPPKTRADCTTITTG